MEVQACSTAESIFMGKHLLARRAIMRPPLHSSQPRPPSPPFLTAEWLATTRPLSAGEGFLSLPETKKPCVSRPSSLRMIPPLPKSLWLQCESFFSRSILSGDGNKEVVAPFHVIFPPLGFGGGGGGHVQSPQDVQHCLSFNVF